MNTIEKINSIRTVLVFSALSLEIINSFLLLCESYKKEIKEEIKEELKEEIEEKIKRENMNEVTTRGRRFPVSGSPDLKKEEEEEEEEN